jgi:putative SOS response-associated peptidase YedK
MCGRYTRTCETEAIVETFGIDEVAADIQPGFNIAPGRMAVVLPQGALFRKAAEGEIRRQLLEHDMVEAVVGLAGNIFYGTELAPAVVVYPDGVRHSTAQNVARASRPCLQIKIRRIAAKSHENAPL